MNIKYLQKNTPQNTSNKKILRTKKRIYPIPDFQLITHKTILNNKKKIR